RRKRNNCGRLATRIVIASLALRVNSAWQPHGQHRVYQEVCHKLLTLCPGAKIAIWRKVPA
ncbi:MAG: hypothetical protein V3T06_01875, partial [Dehalococcoidia bacterium]